MPQISIWSPTRALAKRIALKRSETVNRPVKQNELVHESLILYAKTVAGMTEEEVRSALATPAPPYRKRGA